MGLENNRKVIMITTQQGCHLLRLYYMPEIVLSTLMMSFHFILTTPLHSIYQSHFTDDNASLTALRYLTKVTRLTH